MFNFPPIQMTLWFVTFFFCPAYMIGVMSYVLYFKSHNVKFTCIDHYRKVLWLYTLYASFSFISECCVRACPQEALQQCHGTLFWWMVTFIGLLMLNEPCSSCFNWMLFMWPQVCTPTPCGAPPSHRPRLRHASPLLFRLLFAKQLTDG